MEQRVPFTWIDVDTDAEGLKFVQGLQGGVRTIPTIVFPDGSHLIEPSNAQLAEKLGLQLRAQRTICEDGLIGLGLHYCATCDAPFHKGASEIVVIGGGNSAPEESLYVATIVEKVTILTHGELSASALVQEAVRCSPKIEVHTGMDIMDFERKDGRLGAVIARERASGREQRFEPAAAFVFVGLDPNTQFLRVIVDLDEMGFITTDDSYATSLDRVFATGDVRSGATRQVGSAVGQGIAALLSVRRVLERNHLKASNVAG